jgi:methionyl-tRNA formyltransferase
MRLVFAGTPDAAVPSLRALAASDHDVVATVTRRDAPIGRKRVITPSAVAVTAEELGIETIRTDRLDAAATERIVALEPDLGVIVAYGGLVREPLLSSPVHGWINLHFSLLPRWRGAAPVQRALIAGDAVSGAAVFQLVAGLDAGDVFATREYPVPEGATAGEVLAALSVEGAQLLSEVVDAIAGGTAVATPQRGEPTLAPKLTDDDGRIRWGETRDAVLARIRGVTPEPGAHTTIDGARVKILAAHAASDDAPRLESGVLAVHDRQLVAGTSTEPLILDRVQPAGRAPMNAADWWRGRRAADSTTRVGT